MEAWEDEAVVLAVRAHGEGHALASVLARQHGHWRGHVRGGQGKAGRGVWQPGNRLALRWTARLSDQLGHFAGELTDAAAARALDDPASLAVLSAACALAEGALHEREAHPLGYLGLAALMERIAEGDALVPDYVRWEVALLAELGYGLDLSSCAVTGVVEDLGFVSPRSGRAVSREAAAPWKERLLLLPAFLLGNAAVGEGDVAAGLRLTGHFLARDVFGLRNLPLPPARLRLADRFP